MDEAPKNEDGKTPDGAASPETVTVPKAELESLKATVAGFKTLKYVGPGGVPYEFGDATTPEGQKKLGQRLSQAHGFDEKSKAFKTEKQQLETQIADLTAKVAGTQPPTAAAPTAKAAVKAETALAKMKSQADFKERISEDPIFASQVEMLESLVDDYKALASQASAKPEVPAGKPVTMEDIDARAASQYHFLSTIAAVESNPLVRQAALKVAETMFLPEDATEDQKVEAGLSTMRGYYGDARESAEAEGSELGYGQWMFAYTTRLGVKAPAAVAADPNSLKPPAPENAAAPGGGASAPGKPLSAEESERSLLAASGFDKAINPRLISTDSRETERLMRSVGLNK